MSALTRSASMAILLVWLLSLPGAARADDHVLVLAVETQVEAEQPLAQLADAMLRDAVLETPGMTLIEWTPTHTTVVSTCQTARVDEACLDAVAARYHADYVIVPYIEHHADQDREARHVEAQLFDAREGTLGDPACAALDGGTDPEVALALVEVLLAGREDATEEDVVELDAGEGRRLQGHFSASLRAPDAAHPRRARGASVRELVPSASPCAALSQITGATGLCHGDRGPAPEALAIVDGAGPAGHIIAADDEAAVSDDGGDVLDRMLERVRLSGRFSRSGVRVGAKIAF